MVAAGVTIPLAIIYTTKNKISEPEKLFDEDTVKTSPIDISISKMKDNFDAIREVNKHLTILQIEGYWEELIKSVNEYIDLIGDMKNIDKLESIYSGKILEKKFENAYAAVSAIKDYQKKMLKVLEHKNTFIKQ